MGLLLLIMIAASLRSSRGWAVGLRMAAQGSRRKVSRQAGALPAAVAAAAPLPVIPASAPPISVADEVVLKKACPDAPMADVNTRVALVVLLEKAPLLRTLTEDMRLDDATARWLIALGSVYYAHEGRTKGKMERTTDPTLVVPAGARVRVHLEPKRYPACQQDNWPQRLAFCDDKFVVLEKPAGVVCMAHVSNSKEVLHNVASEALGMELMSLHRIDQWTTGLVALARGPDAVRHFHALLQANAVKKRYRALTTAPVSVGPMLGYSSNGGLFNIAAPRPISTVRHDRWRRCALTVLSCRPIQIDGGSIDGWQGNKAELLAGELYESEVDLETGRTHQIRAQFAAAGAPLVGDSNYIPMAGYLHDDLGEESSQAFLTLAQQCRNPDAAIGLQCCELSFAKRTVKAGPPWWRGGLG